VRVLHLARAYPNNVIDTLGTWTAGLVRELARHCDVRVISPTPYCPPLPHRGPLRQYTRFRSVLKDERRDGIDVFHPPFVIGPGQRFACLEHHAYEFAVRGLAERLHRTAPFDLIHAHFIYPDGVVASRLAKRWGVPFVVTDQAPWEPWLDRRCIRSAAVPAARAAAHLVCVSEFLRSTIRHYLGESADVEVIPNGVDPDAFPLGPAAERAGRQIAYVGLINFNKGIDVLLEAMKLVAEEDADAHLVLVGGSYYRNTHLQEERLRHRASELGLDDRVTFAGRRRPQEVARVMRQSAVLTLPSRAETFGSVLIEALASGTPVVASASGGPQEVVDDSVGRIVPVGDAPRLAEALLEVLAKPERYPHERLRAYALERYAWPSVAERYLHLYRRARA
jgi:teichuronic acid biosynthesis glycosyltransferase TuaC